MSANPAPKILSEFEAKRLVSKVNKDVGEARGALKRLHDEQGWRALNYESFSAFIDAEIHLARQYVYDILDSVDINLQLSAVADAEIPTRQTRILKKVPEERRPEIYLRSMETAPNGRLTAKHIRETAEVMDAFPLKRGDRGPEMSADWGRGKSGKLELAAKVKTFEPDRMTLFAWKCIEAVGHTQRWEIAEECESVTDTVKERAAVRGRLGL